MIGVIALVILAVTVVAGILAVLMVRKKKKEGKQVLTHRVFFLLGITCVPFSIVLMLVSFILQIPFYIHSPLLAVGLVYLVIGLKNRDKWKISE